MNFKKILLLSLFMLPLASLAQEVKELNLNKDQLAGYSKSYKTAEVIHLRKFLNRYVNTRTEIAAEEENAAKILDGLKIDKNILKGKFMVYQYSNLVGGGKGVSIVSQDHPEVILDFWVYKIDDKNCEVRDLLIQADNRNLDSFKIVYRSYLHHKTLYM
ncbi:hypothetical protein H8L32_09330 [Undibacterium sp. CY18W]|uniref:DUF3828 domain-containing protein n=1 Tax=Undibacterium hunanense TaxID=2762292 RepID=A0ABR6ZP98_9BURK|nr:hypothetical protein [Undibacterium hunanense]MBC3917673.1 hypothetical protein [Undibacterium hunanense]